MVPLLARPSHWIAGDLGTASPVSQGWRRHWRPHGKGLVWPEGAMSRLALTCGRFEVPMASATRAVSMFANGLDGASPCLAATSAYLPTLLCCCHGFPVLGLTSNVW